MTLDIHKRFVPLRRRRMCRLLFTFVAMVLGTLTVRADERPNRRKIEPLLTALNNPCAIAIHPGSGALYVAESGAGRIVRVHPSDRQTLATVIEGFPQEDFGPGPSYRIGPLGLAFIDRSTLVVGEGGQSDGVDVVRIYTLLEDGKPLRYDQSKHVLGPFAAGSESATGEGDFFGVAVASASIFISSHGDDSKGWILRADRSTATEHKLLPFVKTKAETAAGAPGPLAISKRDELVVGQIGKLDQAKDSLLTFYHPNTGKKLLNLETGLHDITGLAFCPQSGRLYAVDFAWTDPSQGGLFRLDMDVRNGRQAIKLDKLESLDRPTALVCPAEGTMYVTTFGDGSGTPSDPNKKTGRLLKITGEF